ncbi:MAG: SBBP repeat-containing protein [Bryobacteraceae bacterium]|nr:SBBP repeat-containing protein [Bryobacteraceae bacterium]
MRRGNSAMFFAQNEALLAVSSKTSAGKERRIQTLRFQWVNGSTTRISGEAKTGGVSNYLIGNNPANWKTGIPQFGRVRYHELYPGVDLVYYGKDGALEYDLVVAPGADTSAIRLLVGGADKIELRAGELVLHTPQGEVVQGRPVVYQQIAGVRKAVDSQYRIGQNGQISFQLGAYDRSKELVIDPTIAYSVLFGGSASEQADAIAVDSTGAAYIAGQTLSTNLVTVGPFQAALAGGSGVDAFVMKLNPAGTAVVYSTYLGGNGFDAAHGIAVDSAGAAYIVGETNSSAFPTFAPLDTSLSGSSDGFLTKLLASGASVGYSTYLGGSGIEIGNAVAVDAGGSAFAVGSTTSVFLNNLPAGAGTRQGTQDAFITKITATPAVAFTRYIGGTGIETAYAVAVRSSAVYVAGETTSTNLTGTALQTTNGGGTDAFIAKLVDSGASQTWFTYFGGTGTDSARGIALDQLGNVYVAGKAGAGLPVANARQSTFGGGTTDGFVLATNTDASVKHAATYLGGSGEDTVWGIALNPNNSIFVAGSTASSNFPVTNNLKTTGLGASTDAFVTKYSVRLAAYLFSTYLGGTGTDVALGIAADTSGAYLTGYTLSTDFQSATGTLQAQDAFLMKLTSTCTFTFNPNPVAFSSAGGTITVNVTVGSECGWTVATSDSFLTLSTDPFGAANGSFTVTATSNSGAPPRSGSITVGGVTLPVTQASACTYGLSSSSTSVGSGTTTGTVNVIPSIGTCAWTAASSQPWATITSATSGTGTSAVNFSVGINPLPAERIATLTIGGQTYTITQAARVRNGDAVSMYKDGGWRQDAARAFVANSSTLTFAWGTPGYTAVAGDWNGDGITKVGVFLNGTWILDMNNSRRLDAGDLIFQWGTAGTTPVVGDWDGDGTTNVGVFTAGNWYLDLNGNRQLDGGEAFAWGPVTGTPMVGDWNGSGKTKVGSYNPANGVWILDTNGDKTYQFPSDFHFQWGTAGFTPLVGDFFGRGVDNVAVYRTGQFWIESGDGFSNVADLNFTLIPSSSGTPVVGDWNNSGETKVGILTGNQFTLDYDGNGILNLTNDKQFTFGTTGDTPVIGRWNP